jgi:hypothetical protein
MSCRAYGVVDRQPKGGTIMNTLLRMLTRLTALLVVAPLAFAQGSFTSTQDGNWSVPGVWHLDSGVSAPDGIPHAGDNVTIRSADDVTIDVDAACASLTLNDGTIEWADASLLFMAGKSLTVNGDFKWGYDATHPGSVNMTSGGTLILKGLVTISAQTVLVPGAGSVEFGGTAPQAVPALTYNNLTYNGTSTGTLAGNVTVNSVFTLASGSVSTGANKIVVVSDAAGAVAITGGSVNGEVERTIAASASGTYQFTNVNTFIVPSSDPSAITVSVRSFPNTFIPTGNPSLAIKRYYTVTASGALTGTLRMAYVDPDELQGLNEAIFSAWFYTGSSWVDHGGVVVPSSDYVEVGGISDWANWTIAEAGGALPIQLASFAASVVRDRDVEVAWRTITETNNYGFEVYRKRSETGDWMKLGLITGHGTTLAPHSYSYVDQSVPFGKYYYRIKQVDLDGKSATFPVMTVTVRVGPDEFVLAQNYPNPFNPSTVIEFVVPQSGFAVLKVYNVLGQQVATLFEGNAEAGKISTASFDAQDLPSGLYFYTLRSMGKLETKRMLLMK